MRGCRSLSNSFTLLLLALAIQIPAPDARADCALIPAALKELPSVDGAVDRPFAAPGDTVTILSDASCKPGSTQRHFDPIASNNEITITFQPPGGTETVLAPFPPAAVLDARCGQDRCFSIEFQMPAATGTDGGGSYPLTGPARIVVTNVVAGQQVAEISTLFQPVQGCEADNRRPHLMRHFTVLPPRNTYSGANSTLNATIDGSGSLLIPMNYTGVLAQPEGNDAALRLLTVSIQDGSFPNGLLAGNDLPGIDGSEIRIPRQSRRFLRAFSFGGRPIPPLLKVTASTPLARASDGLAFGDTILGSVDFIDSVIRISRVERNPLNPASPVVLFSIPKELGAATGLEQRDGKGPVEISGVTLAVGAAAPLNSLRTSEQIAVVARSEKLSNQSSPNPELVVEFTELADGNEVDTGMAVVETARSPRKPVIATAGSSIAFFQSEFYQGGDLNFDGTVSDSIFRVWTADGSHGSCFGTACDLAEEFYVSQGLDPVAADPALAIVNSGSPSPVSVSGIADPGRYVFFGASEVATLPFTNERESLLYTGAEAGEPSVDATISSDGNVVGFSSSEADTAQFSGPVGSPGPVAYHYTGNAYDTFGNGTTAGAYGTSHFAQVTLLRDSLLPANLNNVNLLTVGGGRNILFNDGRQLIASRNNNFNGGLFISTDGAGNITEWNLQLGICGVGCSVLTRSAAHGALDSSSIRNSPQSADTGSLAGNQGSWVTDTTPHRQVYVRDRSTLANELISLSPSIDFPGDAPSNNITLSGLGDRAAFDTEAANLIGEGQTICCPLSGAGHFTDVEGYRDVYMSDRFVNPVVHTMARLSQNGGVGGDGDSSNPDMSDDGLLVAYESLATNLVAGDTNGVSDIFVNREDPASPFTPLTNERVSLTNVGGEADGDSNEPALSGDANEVVFQSDATNLVDGDTNGVTDIYLRDRGAGTTERISVGNAGAEPNGASTRPDVTVDGRYVVFESDASNLLAPGSTLNHPHQCYVRDRLRNSTELVSAAPGGEGADAACLEPSISANGRFVSFAAAATNLTSGTDAVQRIYLFDRLTGVVSMMNRGIAGVVSVGPSGTRSAIAEGPTGGIVYDSSAGNLLGPLDTNGLSDIYGTVLVDSSSTGLNTAGPFPDFDNEDSVLYVFDTLSGATDLINTGIPIGQMAVAGGRAAVAPNVPGGVGQIYDAETSGGLMAMTVVATEVAISETAFCAVDGAGTLHVGDPTTAVSFSSGVTVLPGIQATGDHCVFIDASGDLGTAEHTGGVPLVPGPIAPAVDFQAAEDGIAFRTCESGADLNGDSDTADCVMRFWQFVPPPPEAPLVDTGHTARLCTFPGCDPFFEPYRVGPNIVSFVTHESDETDIGGSDDLGVSCLSTSNPGECDKTGDRDGNDIAIEIYNLRSGEAQVFPLSEENPPEVPPFPTISAGAGNVMTIQLPAEVLGEDFAALPPDRLVTVLIGDPEGDGVFEADGNLDPQTAVTDLCPEDFDPEQVDLDRDGMAEACDRTLSGDQANDGPGSPAPPLIPGSDPTKLCNLNSLANAGDLLISRAEVDQIWADRGTPISAPADLDGLDPLDATDLRDRDADGAITAVDFQLCLADCAAQVGGCPATDVDPTPKGYKACGLLGFEALVMLIPWLRRRRRMQR